jgi:hypothetical protein
MVWTAVTKVLILMAVIDYIFFLLKKLTPYTGCLIKNASTHNFFIYYPISMNKKTKGMVFHALRSSHKIYFFLTLFSVAHDSQLFFLMDTCSFLGIVW